MGKQMYGWMLVAAFFFFIWTVRTANAEWEIVGTAGFSNANNVSIALDGSGTPYVAHSDGMATSVMRFNGESWVQIGNTLTNEFFSFAVNGSGTPHVATHNIMSSDRNIMKFNGASWVQVGTPEYFIGFVLDGNGTPYTLKYFSSGMTSGKISVMRLDGANWVQVGQDLDVTDSSDSVVKFVLDGSGKPYVVFGTTEDIATSKISVMKLDNAGWVQVGPPDFVSIYKGVIDFAIGSSDTPYIAYSDSENGNVSVMRFDGMSWQQIGAAGFINDVGSISLAIDDRGTPYLACKPSIMSGDTSRVMKFDGASWVQVGSSNFFGSGRIRLAIDKRIPYVACINSDMNGKISVMKFAGVPVGPSVHMAPVYKLLLHD